jgi:hypothetical protein
VTKRTVRCAVSRSPSIRQFDPIGSPSLPVIGSAHQA